MLTQGALLVADVVEEPSESCILGGVELVLLFSVDRRRRRRRKLIADGIWQRDGVVRLLGLLLRREDGTRQALGLRVGVGGGLREEGVGGGLGLGLR